MPHVVVERPAERTELGCELVVVANRTPLRRVDEEWRASSGGLVAAVWPVATRRHGAWVATVEPGQTADLPDGPVDGVSIVGVDLSAEEFDGFYNGFSNATLWPLYHDAIRPAEIDHQWWRAYRAVNRRVADAAAGAAPRGATVWVHDYQLQLVPGLMRKRRPDVRIGFFLHIPFPPPELFRQLPWRSLLLEGLLGADLVGFHTRTDVENFLRAVDRHAGGQVKGSSVRFEDRQVEVGAFPISVDSVDIATRAASDDTEDELRRLRARLGNRRVIVGVDRLDYTKGIDRRLRAFADLLASGRADPDDVLLIQIAVPTRDNVPGYNELRQEVERFVGEVNGRHGKVGRPAVEYLHRSIASTQLLALYRLADVMAVTPLRDGMNLVAKEFVAARTDGDGVLILSEFAGAAHELREAVPVNPYDHDALVQALDTALGLPEAERRARMARMREVVLTHTVHDWAASFLARLEEAPRATKA
ncbi:MAG TPA: trehalose-6-phosphate synthase [Acidimicrobiales bacterium]|nr:trehalose-6-phosphate synthase [Acidimicrobiales bacterium]